MAVKDLIASVIEGSPLDRLMNRGQSKEAELAKIDKDLAALDVEKRKLWVSADVDGKDVTLPMQKLEAKRTGLLEARERAHAALEEVSARQRAVAEETARQAVEAGLLERAAINASIDQLDADYAATATAFFAAAARSAAANARQAEISRLIARHADTFGIEIESTVAPLACEEPVSVEWAEFHALYAQMPDRPLSLSLRVATPFVLAATRRPSAHNQPLLAALRDHYNAER